MPQDLYCWRCDMVLPMLDEAEWAQIEPLLGDVMQRIKSYRAEHGVGLREAHGHAFDEALAFYNRLTGFNETNGHALLHHRIALFGPPCTHCGKLLRTPRAKLCAACGRDREPPLSV